MTRRIKKTSALHAAGVRFLSENGAKNVCDAVTTAAEHINRVYWFDIPICQMNDCGVNVWFLLTVFEKAEEIFLYKFLPCKFYQEIKNRNYESFLKVEKPGTSPAWKVYLDSRKKNLYADSNCKKLIIPVTEFRKDKVIPQYFYK